MLRAITICRYFSRGKKRANAIEKEKSFQKGMDEKQANMDKLSKYLNSDISAQIDQYIASFKDPTFENVINSIQKDLEFDKNSKFEKLSQKVAPNLEKMMSEQQEGDIMNQIQQEMNEMNKINDEAKQDSYKGNNKK